MSFPKKMYIIVFYSIMIFYVSKSLFSIILNTDFVEEGLTSLFSWDLEKFLFSCLRIQ